MSEWIVGVVLLLLGEECPEWCGEGCSIVVHCGVV